MRRPAALYEHCVITGASSGFGVEFARQLAPRARRLTLVARREARLRDLARELSARHRIDCACEAIDLATLEGAQELLGRLAAAGVEVDLLVNNAGFGRHAALLSDPWELQQQMWLLNCVTPARLIYGLWGSLTRIPGRGVINVASTAAFQPVPYFATYSATKAAIRFLSHGVGREARAAGMRMTALCPGPSPTEFGRVANTSWSVAKFKIAPERIIQRALVGYERGAIEVLPGLINRTLAFTVQRLAPLRLVLWGGALVAHPPKARVLEKGAGDER